MEYKLHPAQSQIASDSHRFRVVNCGRRFGKTILAVLEMVTRAFSRADQNVCYIATTYGQARDIAWKDLKKICQPIAESINDTRLEIVVHTQDGGTSLISLRGWENVETLRGQKFDLIVLDEVASMRKFWDNWEQVLKPTLLDTHGDVLFLSTPKGFNHFYELFIEERKDPSFKSFHFTSYDNPFISREEVDNEKKTNPAFQQEYMADFTKIEGLVYDFDYDPKFVLDEKRTDYLNTAERVIAGLDFGFTNPTGILIGKVKDGNLYITSEWKRDKKTTPEIIEQCKWFDKNSKVSRWYPDPAEPDRIEEMRRAGFLCENVNKDVEYGISVVKGLIKEKRIHISDKCYDLLDELEQYHYDIGKEVPVKENDHLCDALRYMIVGANIKKEDRFKQLYGSVPFRDKTIEIWNGE